MMFFFSRVSLGADYTAPLVLVLLVAPLVLVSLVAPLVLVLLVWMGEKRGKLSESTSFPGESPRRQTLENSSF